MLFPFLILIFITIEILKRKEGDYMVYLKKALVLLTLLAVLFVIVVFIILPKKNKNVEYKGTLVNGYIQIDRQPDKEESVL